MYGVRDTAALPTDAAITAVLQAPRTTLCGGGAAELAYSPGTLRRGRTCLACVLVALTCSVNHVSTSAASLPPHLDGGGLTPRALREQWVTSPVKDYDCQEGEKQQGSYDERLRRTIEDNVLNDLASSIEEHIESVENGQRPARPFVTLTYAQSIDGSIAAADRSQVSLSGKESHTMTHGLRSIHDAILVGAGTVRHDNPRLNVRHWPPRELQPPLLHHAGGCQNIRDDELMTGDERQQLQPKAPSRSAATPEEATAEDMSPRAVILANNLSELPRSMRLGGAVIFTDVSSPDAWRWLAEWASRSREGSEDRAANSFIIAHCRLTPDGRCDILDCLEKLYSMGFRSLMVEGGASVISSFLRGLDHDARKGGHDGEADRSSGHLVDRVVVTIAPAFLRGFNVLASSPKTAAGRGDPSGVSTGAGFSVPLVDVGYVQLGQDIVVVGSIR